MGCPVPEHPTMHYFVQDCALWHVLVRNPTFECRIGHLASSLRGGGGVFTRPLPLTHFLRNGACAGMPGTEVPPFRKNSAFVFLFVKFVFVHSFVQMNEIIRFSYSNAQN